MHENRTRRLPLALAVALAVSVVGCSRSFSADRLIRATGNEVLGHEVDLDAREVLLDVGLRLRNGAARWTLRDPNGKIREQGGAPGPLRWRERHRFDAIPGVWTLSLDFEDATGRYRLSVLSR